MKRLFILLAVAFLANTALAQEAKIMQVIKNDVVDFQIPVSSIDSIVFGSISNSLDGVIINGIRWATRNVDIPGTFADNPQDAGMFYQWNRRVGWSSTNPIVNSNGGTTLDSSNPEGTEWYAENDPCPAGWRVPTREELQSLNSAGSIWITHNGINGRLFGTVAPNQIFLPAAGHRFFTPDALLNVGARGNYWSSTQIDGEFAQGLWFNSGSVDVSWYWRTNGLSVRCVAE